MNTQYKCKYFIIEELVDPETYKKRGDRAWELLDYRMLVTIDRLREKYGKMTINNWKWGKDRMWSGLRTPESAWYSQYSQHTYGRAADIIFHDITAEEVRQDIIANPDDPAFEFINSIELGTSWLHADVRNTNKLKTFKP